MADSDLQRCLEEVVVLIRALPVDFDNCRDLSECIESATKSVQEAAPAFVQRWPVLLRLLAATSSDQVIPFLVDLAVRSRCPMAYLSPDENYQLSESGLSSREQLLLGRLRERVENNDAPS